MLSRQNFGFIEFKLNGTFDWLFPMGEGSHIKLKI